MFKKKTSSFNFSILALCWKGTEGRFAITVSQTNFFISFVDDFTLQKIPLFEDCFCKISEIFDFYSLDKASSLSHNQIYNYRSIHVKRRKNVYSFNELSLINYFKIESIKGSLSNGSISISVYGKSIFISL